MQCDQMRSYRLRRSGGGRCCYRCCCWCWWSAWAASPSRRRCSPLTDTGSLPPSSECLSFKRCCDSTEGPADHWLDDSQVSTTGCSQWPTNDLYEYVRALHSLPMFQQTRSERNWERGRDNWENWRLLIIWISLMGFQGISRSREGYNYFSTWKQMWTERLRYVICVSERSRHCRRRCFGCCRAIKGNWCGCSSRWRAYATTSTEKARANETQQSRGTPSGWNVLSQNAELNFVYCAHVRVASPRLAIFHIAHVFLILEGSSRSPPSSPMGFQHPFSSQVFPPFRQRALLLREWNGTYWMLLWLNDGALMQYLQISSGSQHLHEDEINKASARALRNRAERSYTLITSCRCAIRPVWVVPSSTSLPLGFLAKI